MKNDAEVEGRQIRLGDIALIESISTQTREQLQNLVIGVSPRVGYVARVTQQVTAARLVGNSPDLARQITWQGARVTVVRSIGRTFSSGEYIDVAKKLLTERLNAQFRESSIVVKGEYRDLLLPSGAVSISPRLVKTAALNKRTCVWVDLSVDGALYQSMPIWFEVAAYDEVLVATKDIPALAAIDTMLFQRQYRDIVTLKGTPARAIDALQGRRLERSLRRGEPLVLEFTAPIPAVAKGQQVTVLAMAGNISLQTVAEALDDGSPGDLVRLKTINGSSMYQAVVAGAGLVNVDGEVHEE